MRFLKNSRERFLLTLFVSIVVLLGLGIGVSRLLDRQAYIQSALFRLRSENMELKSWFAEKALIEARGAWLDAHLPVSSDIRRNGLEFLESLEQQAKAAEMQITAKSILDPQSNPDSTAIPIRLTVQGEFRNLALFLHAVQQPGDFVMLREINVKAAGGSSEVVSELELLKVFQPSVQGKGHS